MLSTRIALSLATMSLLSIAACSSPVETEVSNAATADAAESESIGSALTPDDATYYAFSRRDMRRCASPQCGGIFVKAVNAELRSGAHRGETKCADGKWATECYVAQVTYTSFGRNGRSQAAFDARFTSGKALVRGALTTVTPETGAPYGTLVANEAWGARTDKAASGTVASLTLSDARCTGSTCAVAYRDLVNGNGGPVAVNTLVYGPGFTAADRNEASAQGHKAGRGLLTAGTVSVSRGVRTHTVTQFFTRVDPKLGAEGDGCGTRGSVECGAGLYCAFAAGTQCGAADQGGTCTAPTGMMCPQVYQPVCGCDGKTYGNACSAGSAGASVAYDGECIAPPAQLGESCGGNRRGAAQTCAEGLFCNYALGDICGFADAAGTCAEVPTICFQAIVPVCGCDGNTYGNSCFANAKGVAVAATGACATPQN